MEKLIKKWWFYVIALIIAFIPPITQEAASYEKTTLIIKEVLQNPLAYKIELLYPLTKIILILMVLGPIIFKNKFRRIFPSLFILLMLGVAIFQNISLETRFGYVILLGNILIQALVIISWIYEIKIQKNDFSKFQFNWWKILCLALGLFAFWMPARDGMMHFSISDLIMNEAGLTYCMITPVALAIMLLYFPNINKVTFRITSFVGLYFGVMNLITWFLLDKEFWWMGVLHFPLFIVSLIGVIVSKSIKS